MKIGILTFHRALNVGAVLQAWALQKYIQSLGHDVEIIDYGRIGCPSRFNMRSMTIRGFAGAVVRYLNSLFVEGRRRNKYQSFLQQEMRLSPRVNQSVLKELVYDAFVCGSDLIWHPDRNEGDTSFYLDFIQDARIRRIAYAPSFGVTVFSTAQAARLKELLLTFNNLSVRETQSQQLCKDAFGLDVDIVCDPTFLIDVVQYQSLERKVNGLPSRYVLLYVICAHPFAGQVAASISKRLGVPVVYYLGGNNAKWISSSQKGAMMNVGPAEFLYLIHHAECVVTNSFHGMVFALLYHHTPYVMANNSPADRRMVDVLETCEQGEYIAFEANKEIPALIGDWRSVDIALNTMKKSGINYLAEALK